MLPHLQLERRTFRLSQGYDRYFVKQAGGFAKSLQGTLEARPFLLVTPRHVYKKGWNVLTFRILEGACWIVSSPRRRSNGGTGKRVVKSQPNEGSWRRNSRKSQNQITVQFSQGVGNSLRGPHRLLFRVLLRTQPSTNQTEKWRELIDVMQGKSFRSPNKCLTV